MNDKKFLINNDKLVKEWNYEKNINLNIQDFTIGSHTKVWWKCSNGHEWQADIVNRSRGTNCPYCSGKYAIKGVNDLKTLYPDLSMEWNYEKNGNLKPQNFTSGSNVRVWWKCHKGHEWEATIRNRTKGNGCPFCSGRYAIKGINDFKTVHPELLEEWNFEKNTGIEPDELLPSSGKKVWWKCYKGHEWEATLNKRHNGAGCPICNSEKQTSFPEMAITYYLGKCIKVENRQKVFGKEVDIFIPSIGAGIEYDGKYYHNNGLTKKREKLKNDILKKNNIFLIRIKESNVNFFDEKNNILYCTIDKNYDYLSSIINKILSLLNKKYNLNLCVDVNCKRDNINILNEYKLMKKSNSIVSKNKNLAKEWNYEKNKLLNPEYFDVNSGYKVWWKCSKGHEWQATIDSRNRGNGCPFCSGRYAILGETDLETQYPKLIKEWNYEKNNELLPSMVTPSSEKKVWWKCSKEHEWQATISNRTKGTNCPYCSGKKVLKGFNDLKTWCENNNKIFLINEFDTKKNNFGIEDITYGSSRKVWWICPKSHSYETYLTHRTKMNTGCPFCSNRKLLSGYNDLATTHPEIAQEWDYSNNKDINPSDVMAGNNIVKYWFICPNGHHYQSTLLNRKNGGNCPICRKISK